MTFARIVTLAAIGLSVCSAPAFADGGRGNINTRQERQQARIYQGIKSGSLTVREAERLETQEARVAALEARDRRSGDGLSPNERRSLERALNHESHQIYDQKHDAQHRGHK